MWSLDSTPLEVILRSLVIYFALFVLFRLGGKKQLGQMSPLDLILVLIISEAVSNALVGDEKSITGGLISAITLVGAGFLMDTLTFKFQKFEKLAEGESKILILDGVVNKDLCKKERLTQSEIEMRLRELQIESTDDVRVAFLETSGHITAFKKEQS